MIRALRPLLEKSWAYNLFRDCVLKPAAADKWTRDWLNIKSGQAIIDMGCGTGEALASMQGVNYLGLDNNADYIRQARTRFCSRGEFRVFDVRHEILEETAARDVVLAQGVLHHLDDAGALRLLELAKTSLKQTGRLLALDGVFHEGQSRLSKLMVSWDRGRFVRNEEDYLKLARSVFPVVKHEILTDMLRIPFSHIVMECRLE